MRSVPALRSYRSKRDFAITREPSGTAASHVRKAERVRSFVVQKHWARRLHYDFRLELDGTLKSWAIPKGPSLDPKDKRLSVQVEDHPIEYGKFEGTIPAKQYGAGRVVIWDRGTWAPLGDARRGLRAGHLKFELRGGKLRGRWALVRIKGERSKQPAWLLIKEQDEFARPAAEFNVVKDLPDGGPAPDRSDLPPGVRRAALPARLDPQLATLVSAPPTNSGEWIYEVKFDGYRLLVRVEGAEVRLVTRSGHDWSGKLPALHQALGSLQLPDGWYDGEVVVLDARGVSDFAALQGAFEAGTRARTVLYLFDVPFFDGYDLRGAPLVARRQLLQRTLESRPTSILVRFSEEFSGGTGSILTAACRRGLEGLVGKRREAAYVGRRSPDWIKLKCMQRQEFVVGGYTDPRGSREVLGSLLLGVHDDEGLLQYAGDVGTGFDRVMLRALRTELTRLPASRSPFAPGTLIRGKPHWLQPKLVAEVSFAEWTRAGRVRQAVFHGLRIDKSPAAIHRERARTVPKPPRSKAIAAGARREPQRARPAAAAPVAVTHGERVIDPVSGVTKLELVRYYAAVGTLMMEHLRGRPVALVRAPKGVAGPHFFQKHVETLGLAGVISLDRALSPGHPPWLAIEDERGLQSAAQWNVVEFHTRNGQADAYANPDRIVFDLDPGEGLAWKKVIEGADLVHGFLAELGLRSFLKTSGGKGLHVVVPIRTRLGWDAVKAFAQAVVAHLARTLPERFVAKAGAGNRVRKMFVDYLRNSRDATTVCAWSARARPGLGISVPLSWEELAALRSSDQWTVRNASARLEIGNEPWAGYRKSAGDLGAAMRKLRFTPPRSRRRPAD